MAYMAYMTYMASAVEFFLCQSEIQSSHPAPVHQWWELVIIDLAFSSPDSSVEILLYPFSKSILSKVESWVIDLSGTAVSIVRKRMFLAAALFYLAKPGIIKNRVYIIAKWLHMLEERVAMTTGSQTSKENIVGSNSSLTIDHSWCLQIAAHIPLI